MNPSSIPPEHLFFKSTLLTLLQRPSPSPSSSPLRTKLLPLLLLSSLLPYFFFFFFLHPGFSISILTIILLPLTITFNHHVLLPFLVKNKTLEPSPSQEWFQARTLSSMLECIGFAVGAHFVLFGFFDWDGVPVMRKVFASWIAISLAGLVFGSQFRFVFSLFPLPRSDVVFAEREVESSE